MIKLITLTLLVFLGYSSSFSQKKLKGKEIGIDLRNFNNSGNVSFLIRKDTKDSFINKRKNISFSFQSSAQFPDYPSSADKDIPNDFKSSNNNYGRLDFSWGKENYLRLDEMNSKDLYFYHVVLKSLGISNQTSQTLSSSYSNGNLVSINKSSNTSISLNFGLSLVGGLKYNISRKIALGIESGINGGLILGSTENKNTQFTMIDKLVEELSNTKSSIMSFYFHPTIINAIWLSYKF